MTGQHTDHEEPIAAAAPEERRRMVTATGLFLAGPVIWASHFMVVYLVAEAVCAAGTDVRVLGLHVLSTVTLVATGVALVVTAVTTVAAYRRWRRSGIGWDADAAPDAGGVAEQEGRLALAGFLLGILFALAVLFVGLPALALEPC